MKRLASLVYDIDAELTLFALTGDNSHKRRAEAALFSIEKLLTRIRARTEPRAWQAWLDYRTLANDEELYFGGGGFEGISKGERLKAEAYTQAERMKREFPLETRRFDI